MSVGESEIEKRQMKRAWTLILYQHLDYAIHVSSETGPGISVFRMLRETKETSEGMPFNCEYYYARKDSNTWKRLIHHCPNGAAIEQKYDCEKTMIICIQIPTGVSGNNTFDELKLLTVSGEEVDLEENVDAPEKSNNGLRRRAVTTMK